MQDKELFSGGGGGLTIKEQVAKYLSYYPLFIIFIAVSVGTGLLYIKYAVPQYRVSTLLFVKKEYKPSTASDLVETALTGAPTPLNSSLSCIFYTT